MSGRYLLKTDSVEPSFHFTVSVILHKSSQV